VGACLSGGLDSSLLAALAARASGGGLRTYAIRFTDPELDESPFQRCMADRLGTAHAAVTLGRADVAAAFPAVIRAAETPLLRAAPAPIARLASRIHADGVKVVLTGEGADEVFGGYDLFREAKVRAFCARRRDSRLRPLLLKRLYPYLTFTRDQTPAVLKSYFAALDDDLSHPAFSHRLRFAAGARCEAFLDPQFREQMNGFDPEAQVVAALDAALRGRGVLQRAQVIEARTLLAGYLLSSQGDRMLMAHSVEGRYPYLDHRVIEFGNALAPQLKVRVLREKYLLKRCARGLVPPAIVDRPKQPYRAPDAVAFVGAGRPAWVGDVIGERALRHTGYFDARRVGRLVRKLETAAGRGDPVSHADSLAFMAVLSTQLWHNLFQEGR
jgi:asparagine synthase (glutamine-hydrolysing)